MILSVIPSMYQLISTFTKEKKRNKIEGMRDTVRKILRQERIWIEKNLDEII